MMHNDSRSRLFRLQLKLLRKCDIDPRRIEQRKKFLLILEPRASRITKTVTRSLILLMKQLRQDRRIITRDAELFAHPLVPELRQRLRTLHAQTMEVQVVGIIV